MRHRGQPAVKRVLATCVLLVGVLLVLLGAASGDEERTYRVDAIFDNAAGLIPGQDVKIAGARVGSVDAIHLTRGRKARVQMKISKGFAPFRSDADCVIRPQSLIGEKFVQCDPGTPRGRTLAERDGTPTVPLGQTHSPVDLDLVFAALRRPYRERLAILMNELGAGLAGRPEELSEAIRRANPALQETRRVLAILGSDRDALRRLVERSDRVLAELAAKDRDVVRFVDRADVASRAVARRTDDLSESVRLLPALLQELEPSANRLAALSNDATPLVRDLRRSAEPLRAVLADVGPLSDAARPALAKLSEMSKTGRRAVRSTRPVAAALRPVARRLPPIAELLAQLNESMRDTGSIEGLQNFSYYAALATSRFDRISHILPSYQVGGTCQQYAEKPVPGCSAHWAGSAADEAAPAEARARKRHRHRHRARRRHAQRPSASPSTPGSPGGPRGPLPRGPLPGLPEAPPLPDLPELPVLDYLLGK